MSRLTRWFVSPLALVPVLAFASPGAAQSRDAELRDAEVPDLSRAVHTASASLASLASLAALQDLAALSAYAHTAHAAVSALSPVTAASIAFEPQSDTLYRAAQNAMNDGDYRRAADLYRQLVDRYPRSSYVPQAMYNRAFSLSFLEALESLASMPKAPGVDPRAFVDR